MAEQYLNKEGVQTLWTATKNKISTAQTTVENEFVNGTKKAKYAQQADNIGGVALGGLVQSIKVGSTTYSPKDSVITLGDYSLTTHTHTFASLTSKPTTLSGYGITDAYTQDQANSKFQAKGSYATLDSNGKVPSSQLPSYVDDVIEGYYSNGKFYSDSAKTKEITGEGGKIYTDLTSNKTYRWGGTAWVEISASLAIGTTAGTAYDGASGAKNASDIATLNGEFIDRGKKITLIENNVKANQANIATNTSDIATLKNGKADKATTLAGYGITDAVPSKSGHYIITNDKDDGITLKYFDDSSGSVATYVTGGIIDVLDNGVFINYETSGIHVSSQYARPQMVFGGVTHDVAVSSDLPTAISTSDLNAILV